MPKASEILLRRLKEALPRYESKRQMAAKLGLHEGTLNKWLSGMKVPNPSLTEIEAIAAGLGTATADLFSRDQPPVRPAVDPSVVVSLIKGAGALTDALSSAADRAAALSAGLQELTRGGRAGRRST